MRGPRAGAIALSLLMVAGSGPLVVAGCGHTQVVGPSRTLQLTVTEYRLIPEAVRASAGQLTIFVHNDGHLTHNLVVSLRGHEQGATRPIPPGHASQVTLSLRPGQYLMASTILSEQSLGAYGTLTITAARQQEPR